MRSLICLFVVSLVFFNESQCSSETGRMVKFLLGENNLLNCISDFNEDCINSYGKGSIEKLLVQPEIPLDSHFSLERIGDAEHRNGGGIKNLWSLTEISNTIERFMKDHALKIQFGNMVGRVFESRSKPDNLEFTIDAVGRRRGDDDDDDDDDDATTGKSQRLYRVVIPLVMGFKVTGMIIFGIFAVKLFLIKATLVANAALLVSGFIVLKKLYDHGINMINSHHFNYLSTHSSIPSYYGKDEGLTGYGYYGSGGYDHYSHEATEHSNPVPDLATNDLQGHYSHHALAMAALNKTLQSRPKRRWSMKWAGRR